MRFGTGNAAGYIGVYGKVYFKLWSNGIGIGEEGSGLSLNVQILNLKHTRNAGHRLSFIR